MAWDRVAISMTHDDTLTMQAVVIVTDILPSFSASDWTCSTSVGGCPEIGDPANPTNFCTADQHGICLSMHAIETDRFG